MPHIPLYKQTLEEHEEMPYLGNNTTFKNKTTAYWGMVQKNSRCDSHGQVTIFIIVGLVILLLAGILVSIRFFAMAGKPAPGAQNIQEASLSTAPVQTFVEACLKQAAEEGVLFLGRHGGYYDLPELADPDLAMPYYFYEDRNALLPREELQQQLSVYLQQELFFCLKNFVPFRQQGYDVTYGNKDIRVELSDADARIQLYFPVTLASGTSAKTVAEFSTTIPTRIGEIHGMIAEFLSMQEQQPDSICISCLVSLGIAHHARVEMYRVSDDAVWFSIVDEGLATNGEQFSYNFLNKYLERDNDAEAHAEE